ncbi:hypothetical protein MTO96_046712, partial [Rhipicephalus appendiculatus]
MHVDGLYRTLARWRRTHLDPLFQVGPRKGVPAKKSINQTTNSFLLYGSVFVGGAVATFMLVLAILAPSSRTSGNNRLPLVAAQRANERTVRRSHGLIFSRQSVLMPSEGGTTAVPVRPKHRAKEGACEIPTAEAPARQVLLAPGAGPLADAERRIRQMTQLKLLYPTLRVLVGVGGPKVDSKSFSDELITEGRREHLAQRSVRWLRARRLDGMHIQW